MTTTSEVRVTLQGMAVGDSRHVETDNRHSARTMLAKEAKTLGWTISTRRTDAGLRVHRLT